MQTPPIVDWTYAADEWQRFVAGQRPRPIRRLVSLVIGGGALVALVLPLDLPISKPFSATIFIMAVLSALLDRKKHQRSDAMVQVQAARAQIWRHGYWLPPQGWQPLDWEVARFEPRIERNRFGLDQLVLMRFERFHPGTGQDKHWIPIPDGRLAEAQQVLTMLR